MTPNLYELTQDMLRLQEELEGFVQEDGRVEAPDEVLATYINFERASEEKVEGIIRFIENLDIDAAVREAEYHTLRKAIEKHQLAAKTARNKAARLKQFILWHMIALSKSEIKTNLHKIKICNNGGNAEVRLTDAVKKKADGSIDFRSWDQSFYEIILEPDKDAIRQAAAAGNPVPDGVEVVRGQHIRIS
jgi:hypothetical protein